MEKAPVDGMACFYTWLYDAHVKQPQKLRNCYGVAFQDGMNVYV